MIYRVYKVDQKGQDISYILCVPKKKAKEFEKTAKDSNFTISFIHETDDECECDFIFDEKIREPTGCEEG